MEPVWSSLGQATGVAAALAIDEKLELKDVPVERVQEELLRQGCVLFFYTDLPLDSPSFTAAQWLSFRGAVSGPDLEEASVEGKPEGLGSLELDAYRFRPDDPMTLAEFAPMVVNGLDIPLSITASHFVDVPRGHRAFKYIETLYDHSTQSLDPFFDFEPNRGFTTARAYPERAVTGSRAARILSGLLKREIAAPSGWEGYLTRGRAAQLVYQCL